MPAARGRGSGSALEAPAGAGRHRARHLGSRLGQEWSAPPRARDVPRGCRSPASRGGSFVPSFFWPQCTAQTSGRLEPGLLASSGVHPARMRGRRLRGGGGLWSFPRPRVRRGAWGATPEVLIVGRAPAELLGNRPTLRSAGPGSLQGGCSSQQQQKLGAAWAGH